MQELETERLRLRRFTIADLDELAALHGDPAVMRFIDDGRPVTRERVAGETLPAILRAYDELPDGFGHHAIEERAGGRFAGWVSLLPPSSVGLEPGDGIELGYRLRSDLWGRGIAAEAARAAVRHAFDRLGVERIVATTMAVNTGSRRVLEKAGLRYLRTFFVEWPEYLEGAEQGDVVYELTREQWPAAGPAEPLIAAAPATPG
ncbi:MAG TPA: GNAT family N-acetyltransferase [Actinospica sp.]|nr:GNAT family N-acetyltransferase [Actinospica sp.]